MNAGPLTAPFSLLYGTGVFLRNTAFDLGILPAHESGVIVLSVGNLSAGGSGKTPLTLNLAEMLCEMAPELLFAVVSRGYRRHGRGMRLVADRQGLLLSAEVAGDEPVWLADRLQGVPVLVAQRRLEAVLEAKRRFGVKAVLLDDGFQHRWLKRYADVVILDGGAPSWHWRLLPWGRLREPPTSLGRASLVVLTGAESGRLEHLQKWVSRFSDAPMARGGLVPKAIRNLNKASAPELDELRGARIAAACGIARPRRFFQSLEALGSLVELRLSFPDHVRWTPERCREVAGRALTAGVEALVITEKDAVKWSWLPRELPVWVLQMRWSWEEGRSQVERLLGDIVEAASTG